MPLVTKQLQNKTLETKRAEKLKKPETTNYLC